MVKKTMTGIGTWPKARPVPHQVKSGSKGLNFGWNKREGLHSYNDGAKPAGSIDPIVEYNHDGGNCSVTGGYVSRGPAVPALSGAYVFADYCVGELIAVDATTTPAHTRNLGVTTEHPTSFGQDALGDVYIVAQSGTIWKLIAA